MFAPDNLPPRRRTWLKIARIPENKIGWEIEDCKDVVGPVLEGSKKWLEGLYKGRIIHAQGKATCGVGLLFYGPPGRGKTTLANAIIQDIIRNVPAEVVGMGPGKAVSRPCYFTTYSGLLDLKGSIMENHNDNEELLFNGILGESLDDSYNVRVLVLDDVGKEHASQSGWQRNLLHHVLRTRFNNGLPTIVTTNLDAEGWEKAYGTSTYSFIHEAFMYLDLNSENDRDLRM